MVSRNTMLFTRPFENGVLSYYLTESEITTEEGAFTRFGALVEKSDGERAQVLDIFGDRQKTSSLIRELSDGLVTPTSLFDVVNERLYLEEFPN